MKRVAILGTGKIACDLLCKLQSSSELECKYFVGRRSDSPGIKFAKKYGIKTSSNGILDIINSKNEIDIIFDATSAVEHLKHKGMLLKNNFKIINLTPAAIDFKCIPAINITAAQNVNHISMVTCGGQTAIPIIHVAKQVLNDIKYIEVVTTISANSAGPATRYNIGEYQDITEQAISFFSGCNNAKSILVINPAKPEIVMQTCIYLLADTNNLSELNCHLQAMEKRIQSYAPGYEIIQQPSIDDGHIFILIRVHGVGDYLPRYAGNLDIITAAAVKVAEEINIKG